MGKRRKSLRYDETVIIYKSNEIPKWSFQFCNKAYSRARYDELQKFYEQVFYLPVDEIIECEDMGLLLHGYPNVLCNGQDTNRPITTDVILKIQKVSCNKLAFTVRKRDNVENGVAIYVSKLRDGNSCAIGRLVADERMAAASV